MRKNPTALISAGKEMLPGVKPPVAPGNGGVIGISPGIKLPDIKQPVKSVKDVFIIEPKTEPPVKNPMNPPGPTKCPEIETLTAIPPNCKPNPDWCHAIGGPGLPYICPPAEEKKINPLFLYGGIAIALYLLFK